MTYEHSNSESFLDENMCNTPSNCTFGHDSECELDSYTFYTSSASSECDLGEIEEYLTECDPDMFTKRKMTNHDALYLMMLHKKQTPAYKMYLRAAREYIGFFEDAFNSLEIDSIPNLTDLFESFLQDFEDPNDNASYIITFSQAQRLDDLIFGQCANDYWTSVYGSPNTGDTINYGNCKTKGDILSRGLLTMTVNWDMNWGKISDKEEYGRKISDNMKSYVIDVLRFIDSLDNDTSI